MFIKLSNLESLMVQLFVQLSTTKRSFSISSVLLGLFNFAISIEYLEKSESTAKPHFASNASDAFSATSERMLSVASCRGMYSAKFSFCKNPVKL